LAGKNTCYSEPHWDVAQLKEFQESIKQDDEFLVKFMPDQVFYSNLYKRVLGSNCYKIKLTRENKIDQITSYYIAKVTDIWNSFRNPYIRGHEYTVDLVEEMMHHSIDVIVRNDFLLESTGIQFDEHITYEQLVKSGQMSSVKLQPPTNYSIIRETIESIYANIKTTSRG
jgi:LPS sulfotransferase NodH